MKTKYVFAFCNSFLKIDLICDLKNYVNFKYTCSFQRKVLPNLKELRNYNRELILWFCIHKIGGNTTNILTTYVWFIEGD